MAELSRIQTPILPTQQIKNIDYSQAYITVGNELNKQYWQNRQAHLENVSALNKVEASEYGQNLLNKVKSEFNEDAAQFEESGMWHRAGDFIYDMAQKITSDPRLPAIMKDKAQYDAFMKSVADSKWSTSNKEGFMLRAHHASSELKFENDVVSGGFHGISIGDPYDITENNYKVLEAISKIEADKIPFEQIIADPNKLQTYGLPSIISSDGKTVMSHIIYKSGTKESVSKDEVAAAALQLMSMNPDFRNQVIQEETNAFYKKYYDKTTRTFKNVPDEEKVKILANSYYGIKGATLTKLNIEEALGLNPINFIVKDKNTGKNIFNKSKIANYDELNTKCLNIYGIIIEDLYTKGVSQDAINKAASIYANALIQERKLTSDTDGLINLLLSTSINNAYLNIISEVSNAAVNLYSYDKITQDTKFIEDPRFAIEAKNQAELKAKEAELAMINNNVISSMDKTGVVTYDNYLKNNLEQITKISDDLNRITVRNNQIYDKLLTVHDSTISKLGYDLKIGSNRDRLLSVDLSKLDEDAQKQKVYDTEAYRDIRNAIIELKNNQLDYDNLLSMQDRYTYNAKRLYEEYNKNPKDYQDWGWYGIGSDIARFIADHNITTVNEFKKAIKTYRRKEAIHAEGVVMGDNYYLESDKGRYEPLNQAWAKLEKSDAQIQEEINNVLDNLENRYRKKHGESFKFITNTYNISNNNQTLENRLAQKMPGWSTSGGELQVTTLGDGSSGGGILPSQIAKLIGLNQFPITTKTDSKGVTVTEKNIITTNSTPIDGKEFKINGDIYRTEVKFALNPIDQQKGYISYDIICRGASNEYLGTIQCREKADDVDKYLLDVFDQFQPLAIKKNDNAMNAIGVIINSVNDCNYSFESTSATPAKGLTELKYNIENMIARGENGFIYTIKCNSLATGSDLVDPIKVKIVRTKNGYTIEDLSQTDPTTKGIIILPKALEQSLGVQGCDTGWDGKYEFGSLDLAFSALSMFNLQYSSAFRRVYPQFTK